MGKYQRLLRAEHQSSLSALRGKYIQDARWRFSEKDTAELIELQRKILTNAAPAVRARGSLVYATCSWQVSENEAQVKWFLDNYPEFSLQSQSLLGAPLQDSDTMFVAVLQRL